MFRARALSVLLVVGVTSASLLAAVQAPAGAGERSRASAPGSGVRVVPVRGNIYMLAGAGGNIAAQIGDDGVLLVDCGSAENAGAVTAALATITSKPVRYVIDTHGHDDHTGANEAFGRRGAAIIAQENVALRMSTGGVRPFASWPTSTFFTPKKELFFNGEAVEILHQPAAHTDGDVFVYFRRSDVVVTGDIFNMQTFPVIDAQQGGTVKGLIAALNRLLDLTIPAFNQEGGTLVIPGSGRISDEADVVNYQEMVTIIRDRIEHLVKSGSTLAQVLAATPTLDYDARWSAAQGPASTKGFVEAIYNDVSKGR